MDTMRREEGGGLTIAGEKRCPVLAIGRSCSISDPMAPVEMAALLLVIVSMCAVQRGARGAAQPAKPRVSPGK